MLNYYGAHTGRFSGGDKVNLQNLPSRGNTTIRKALTLPDGYEFIACDSSQIEARTVAWLAGQDDLIQSFAEGRDVYCVFASYIYNKPVTKDDGKERFVGKTGILSLGYGAGFAKFKEMLRIQAKITIDEYEAERVVRLYRQKYWKIVQLWRMCDHMLADMVAGRSGILCDLLPYDSSGITLPNGLKITYPGLRRKDSGYVYVNNPYTYRKLIRDRIAGSSGDDIAWTNIYGGKVVENIVQALAGIIVRDQMVRINLAGYFVAFQVHDENVCVVPSAVADEAEAEIIQIMSTPPEWATGLPIACEAGRANNYGDC
jgi:DNA polymerase